MENRLDEPKKQPLLTYMAKSPPMMVFFFMSCAAYAILGIIILKQNTINWIELIKSMPFAVSGIVIGIFSILFWALNYISRNQKKDIDIDKARILFAIRHEAIERVFFGADTVQEINLSIAKAHILFNMREIESEPETPISSIGLDYSDAINALLKRS